MGRVRGFLWFTGLFVICFVLAVIILNFFGGEQPEDKLAFLDTIRTPLLIARIILVLLLVALWPMIMQWTAKRNNWEEPQRLAATQFRWKILFWYLVLELFIVQNVIGKFIDWVS